LQPRCWFDSGALDDLLAEARRWPLRETGGALLGWREGEQSVVARVLGPGPDAKHRLRSFEPDVAWQAERVAEIYAESGRTITYTGDWHTHPLGGAKPSKQDADTAAMLARDTRFRTPIPLYGVVVRDRLRLRWHIGWKVAIYEWRDNDFVQTELVDWH
jgi:integrative and conjugative element protein (TIGR02256 family)